jgi:lysophospholipase L1-like esterase
MRALASQEGAVLVDLYALMLPDVFRYIGVDGLHPNEAGYARMAELFFEAIQRELEVR